MEKFEEQAKPENLERPEDVPLIYERLREEDKLFVLEVRELGKMSEEEFLENNPEVLETKEKVTQNLSEFENLKSFIPDFVLDRVSRYKHRNFTDPKKLGDKSEGNYVATMWDLAKLRLFELQDAVQHPGFYSKQTEYLVEHILDGITESKLDSLPDALSWVRGEEWRPRLDRAEAEGRKEEAMTEKIRVIHRVVSSVHKYLPGIQGASYIKDLWRYVVVRIKNARSREEWDSFTKDFFDRLSNLNLESGEF